MNYSLVEQAGSGTAAQQRQRQAGSQKELTVEELSVAVGQHALLQAEIDHKIAAHIVEMREDLRSAKNEIQLLHAQIDQLLEGLAQALQRPPSQPSRKPQTRIADRLSLNVQIK